MLEDFYMAHFLRDEVLKSLTIDEAAIRELDNALRSSNANMPENLAKQDPGQRAIIYYVVRFDNKGYRVFSVDDLLRYFHEAKYVERVICTAESGTSLKTGRQVGSYIDLALDCQDPSRCLLSVASDDVNWVNSSFSNIKDVLAGYRNRNGWARSMWSQLTAQLLAVFAAFLVSLWAAVAFSPKIPVENAFFLIFLFVLLVFSNLWGYVNQRLLALIDVVFPNIRFYRPNRDGLHWLLQNLIGGVAVLIVVSVILFFLNLLVDYFVTFFGEHFVPGV